MPPVVGRVRTCALSMPDVVQVTDTPPLDALAATPVGYSVVNVTLAISSAVAQPLLLYAL